MAYTHSITVPLPYQQAVERTRQALAEQGFGILTETDIAATFAAKLGPEAAAGLGEYVILGACNPALASRALAAEPQLGALLPCNVVVRRGPDGQHTIIEAIDPRLWSASAAAPRSARSPTTQTPACAPPWSVSAAQTPHTRTPTRCPERAGHPSCAHSRTQRPRCRANEGLAPGIA